MAARTQPLQPTQHARHCNDRENESDASPGPLEFVTHGQNGLVVPHDDAAALARAMLRLQTDPQLRIRLGLAAQDRLKSQDWPVLEPIWKAALAME